MMMFIFDSRACSIRFSLICQKEKTGVTAGFKLYHMMAVDIKVPNNVKLIQYRLFSHTYTKNCFEDFKKLTNLC